MYRHTLTLVFLSLAAIAQADDRAPLDDLLSTPISTAAKYDQRINEVPASVTVISSEEISRYGWHTLADVLSAVRGVYTTYDRGYTYLGVRGVGLPTDFNSRFLVLIDGHPMQEVVSGSVGIGSTLALDLSVFSRIEFVRGPSSVMYGTGAMFGVINLITKDAQEHSELTLATGTRGTRFASGRAGFGAGKLSASIAMSWQENNGSDLYFREFDRPGLNHGVVRGHDFDDYRSVLATLSFGELHAIALQSTRTKGVPTAPWEGTFGGDARTTDSRTLAGVQFAHRFTAASQISLRSYFDRFHYYGDFPGGSTTGESSGALWSDDAVSTRIGAEGQYVRDFSASRRLTIGTRWTRTQHASYQWGTPQDRAAVDLPFTIGSIYAQSEWGLRKGVVLTAGASYDRYSGEGDHLTRRVALIYTPNERTTTKFLVGQGFRLPSVYETVFSRPLGAGAGGDSDRGAGMGTAHRLGHDADRRALQYRCRQCHPAGLRGRNGVRLQECRRASLQRDRAAMRLSPRQRDLELHQLLLAARDRERATHAELAGASRQSRDLHSDLAAAAGRDRIALWLRTQDDRRRGDCERPDREHESHRRDHEASEPRRHHPQSLQHAVRHAGRSRTSAGHDSAGRPYLRRPSHRERPMNR